MSRLCGCAVRASTWPGGDRAATRRRWCGELGVDEAVDGLVADDLPAALAGEPAGDLFGRPAAIEAIKDELAQRFVPLEPRARPAPRTCLLLGIGGLVAHLAARIALQLSRDRRWRAIQSCSDLLERLPVLMKVGNLTPLLQRELRVPGSHGNTSSRCCTSFVNSGDLGSAGLRGSTEIPAFAGMTMA